MSFKKFSSGLNDQNKKTPPVQGAAQSTNAGASAALEKKQTQGSPPRNAPAAQLEASPSEAHTAPKP